MKHTYASILVGILWSLSLFSMTDDDWQVVTPTNASPTASTHVATKDAATDTDGLIAATQRITDIFMQAESKISECMRTICLLTRRTEKTFVQDAVRSYRNNFKQTTIPLSGAYKALGISTEQGKKMSQSQVLRVLQMQQAVGGIDEQRRCDLRQLHYVFGDPLSKEEYDAFLSGSLATLRIKKGNMPTLLQHVIASKDHLITARQSLEG